MNHSSPYYFIGYQEFKNEKIGLYNLNVSVAGHPVGSTVSQRTLEEAGIWQNCKCSTKAGLCINHNKKGD